MVGLAKLIGALGGDKNKMTGPTLVRSAFGSYPAPVMELCADGALKCHNGTAEALCHAVDVLSVPGVAAALERGRGTARAQIEVIVVPSANGALLYEFSILPIEGDGLLLLAKDITLESNLRAALVESRQRYKDLVEISSDFAWETGADGTFVFVSPRGALGHLPEHLVGHHPREFIITESGGDGLLPFIAERPVEDAEVWMRRYDNSLACLATSSSPLLDALGERRGARGICRDVTRERERDAALTRAVNRERLLSYIVRTIRDVVDPSDMLKAAAEAIARAMGAMGCEIFRNRGDGLEAAANFGTIGDSAATLAAFSVHDSHEANVEGKRVLAQLSRYRHEINGAIAVWRSGDGIGWSNDDRLLLDDVADQIGIANEQISNHERILALSRTDSLTGLFNRRAFFEELSRRFSRLARDQKPASLIYVDLDNFKMVNDIFGHRRGDEALLAVRDILLRYTRPIDLLARLGGDEFALWLEGADEAIAMQRCAEMIDAAHAFAHYSGDTDNPLTMSMGVAVHAPARPETLSDLLSRADEAMYAAKREGKHAFRLASPAPPHHPEERP